MVNMVDRAIMHNSEYPIGYLIFLISAGAVLNGFWVFVLLVSIEKLPDGDAVAGFVIVAIVASKVVPSSYYILTSVVRRITIEDDSVFIQRLIGKSHRATMNELERVEEATGYWASVNFPITVAVSCGEKEKMYRLSRQIHNFDGLVQAIRRGNPRCKILL